MNMWRTQAEAAARTAESEARRQADAASAAQSQAREVNRELDDTRTRAHSVISQAESRTSAASSRALEAEARAAKLEQELAQLRDLCSAQSNRIAESMTSSQRLEQENAQMKEKHYKAKNQLRNISRQRVGPVDDDRHLIGATNAKGTDECDVRASARRRDQLSRDQRRVSRHSSTFASDSDDGKVRASRREHRTSLAPGLLTESQATARPPRPPQEATQSKRSLSTGDGPAASMGRAAHSGTRTQEYNISSPPGSDHAGFIPRDFVCKGLGQVGERFRLEI